jgi:hypothetical protein
MFVKNSRFDLRELRKTHKKGYTSNTEYAAKNRNEKRNNKFVDL